MYSSIFRKKYSKKSRKIPKQKIMRSRKRVGGSLEPESTISTTESTSEDTEKVKYNPEVIEPTNTEEVKPTNTDVELGYIEQQATFHYEKYKPETMDDWSKIIVKEGGLNQEDAQITALAESVYGFKAVIIRDQIDTLREYKTEESEKLKANKKLHSNATAAYRQKRSNILKSINKSPNVFARFLTSEYEKKLENIIEEALQKDKILKKEVDELVDLKVEMKRANNDLEKSNYIVGMVGDAITSQGKKYSTVKWKEDMAPAPPPPVQNKYNTDRNEKYTRSTHSTRGSEGPDMDDRYGGSKKRIISKRHIKRRTKRHTQNNKRRYIKKQDKVFKKTK